MSSSLSVYVGPYLVISNPIIENVLSEPGCPQCRRSITTPFCSLCGSPQGLIIKRVNRQAVNASDAVDVIGERLSYFRINQNDYWVANVEFDGVDRHISFQECAITFDSEQALQQQAVFREYFASEIEALAVHYGRPVALSYGVITYIS